MPEFIPFGKIPRLNRDCIITEKLNGTNACVVVDDEGFAGTAVYAQSRKRIIVPGDDNFGFAGWVATNRDLLADTLGFGRHYGEWVGPGIQGNPYNLGYRYFVLFNVTRWAEHFVHENPVGDAFLSVVPELYRGPFLTEYVEDALADLAEGGSVFAKGRPAEGLIVYHVAAGQLFKVTLEGDEKPKGSTE